MTLADAALIGMQWIQEAQDGNRSGDSVRAGRDGGVLLPQSTGELTCWPCSAETSTIAGLNGSSDT
jgi:hypothetical protein